MSAEAPEVWHRLHPLSPVVRGGRVTTGLAILLFLSVFGRGKLSDAIPQLAVVAILLVGGFVSWLVTRWRIEEDDLRIETGLLRRQIAPVPARAGSGDRRRPAGAGADVPRRRAAAANGRRERRDGTTRLRRGARGRAAPRPAARSGTRRAVTTKASRSPRSTRLAGRDRGARRRRGLERTARRLDRPRVLVADRESWSEF